MLTLKVKAASAASMPLMSGAALAQMSPVPNRRGRIEESVPVAKPAASSTSLHSAAPPAAPQKTTAQSAKLARRDRVVLEHLPLVKAIAVRVHETHDIVTQCCEATKPRRERNDDPHVADLGIGALFHLAAFFAQMRGQEAMAVQHLAAVFGAGKQQDGRPLALKVRRRPRFGARRMRFLPSS